MLLPWEIISGVEAGGRLLEVWEAEPPSIQGGLGGKAPQEANET